MSRKDEVIEQAATIINGDRRDDYGAALPSFQRIADTWKPILGIDVRPSDVARCMIALKLCRLAQTSTHVDSWVDIIGYAALGAEIAEQE